MADMPNFISGDRVSQTFCLDWPRTVILLIWSWHPKYLGLQAWATPPSPQLYWGPTRPERNPWQEGTRTVFTRGCFPGKKKLVVLQNMVC
jgi:hypothetical protein